LLRPQMWASSVYALYTPNTLTRLEYTLVGNQTLRRHENALLYNVDTESKQNLQEQALDRSQVLEHRLVYSRRLSGSQALMLNATYSDFARGQSHDLLSPRFAEFFGADSSQNRFLQNVNGAGRQGQAKLQWLIKQNKRLRYRVNFQQQFNSLSLGSGIRLGQAESLQAVENEDFRNRSRWQTLASGLGAGGSLMITEKTSLFTDAYLKRAEVQFDTQRVALWFVEPSVGINTRHKKFLMGLNYTFTQQNPNVQSLYQGFVLANYRAFQRGGEQARFLPTHQLSGNLGISDLENYQSVMLFGTYSRSKPYFGTDNTIAEDFTLTQARLFPMQEFLLISLSADKYIHRWLSGFQLFQTFTYSSSDNQANGFEVSRNQFYVLMNKLQYRSVFDGWYNIEASAQWIFSTARNNLLTDERLANNHTFSYVFTQIVQPSKKHWKWILGFEYFEFRTAQRRETYPFLDTEFSIALKKPKMQLSVEVKNLLNNNEVLQVNLQNFSITTSSQRIQNRWGLLKVQFKW